MLCPNCTQEMKSVVYDNQNVLHCSNCGGNFFEENSINRITARTAKKLDEDKNGNIVLGEQKICPKDNIFLQLIENDEAVPQNVMLFKCPSCRGVFAYSDDLLAFKKAQNVKIDFFKVWGIPLPSLKAVMVLSFMAVVSLSIITSLLNYQNRQTTSTNAADIISSLSTTQSGRYVFISFKTASPVQSKIIFVDKTTNSPTITENVATTPMTIHYLTTTAINPDHEVYFQVILIDSKGKEVATEPKKLEIKK